MEKCDMDFIQKIKVEPEFKNIRNSVDRMMKVKLSTFTFEFDIIIEDLKYPFSKGLDPFSKNIIAKPAESYFMFYLHYRLDRAINVLTEYVNTREVVRDSFNEAFLTNHQKIDFFERRLEKFMENNSKSIFETDLQALTSTEKKTKQNLLNGKKLNLSERYLLANKVFEIDNKIRQLNILDREKAKLLSLILDCNTTNARHLLNGKYPGKIREKVISEYTSKLMK